jgi:hypothetical protein
MRSLLGRIDKAIYFACTRGQEARSAAVVAAAGKLHRSFGPIGAEKVVLRLFVRVEGHYGIAFLVLENNVDRLSAGHHGHAPNRNYFPIAFGG